MKQKPSYADFADSFLKIKYTDQNGILTLRYWSSRIYHFEKTHYVEIKEFEFYAEIMLWLQTSQRENADSRTAREVLANVCALVILRTKRRTPFWIGTEGCSAIQSHACLENGILDVLEYIRLGSATIKPHTPEFFSTSSFPFSFDPSASCPRFLKFLDEMVPDRLTQCLIQEWFGYHIDLLINFEKFIIFFGEGANGKSVILAVLTEMLGVDSVSSVGLEAFNPERTFPLAATVGKRANIVGEIGEVDKAAEGLIKQFVSGNPITIEEKHKPAFSYYPTARLTFSTNVLPRFTDRSDGLWRRLMPIPLKIQILDEQKQDKNLISQIWWRQSGELPGVFNWALNGLKRLHENGKFTDAPESRNAKESFKKDSNPAKVFLTDYFEIANEGSFISSQAIYAAYAEYAKQHGYRTLAHAQFCQEVRRVFPLATLSEHPQRLPTGRTRVWYGLRFLGGTDGTPISDFNMYGRKL